jgi:hypothetical protein
MELIFISYKKDVVVVRINVAHNNTYEACGQLSNNKNIGGEIRHRCLAARCLL